MPSDSVRRSWVDEQLDKPETLRTAFEELFKLYLESNADRDSLRAQLKMRPLEHEEREETFEDLSWMTVEDAKAHYECSLLNWSSCLDELEEWRSGKRTR